MATSWIVMGGCVLHLSYEVRAINRTRTKIYVVKYILPPGGCILLHIKGFFLSVTKSAGPNGNDNNAVYNMPRVSIYLMPRGKIIRPAPVYYKPRQFAGPFVHERGFKYTAGRQVNFYRLFYPLSKMSLAILGQENKAVTYIYSRRTPCGLVD